MKLRYLFLSLFLTMLSSCSFPSQSNPTKKVSQFDKSEIRDQSPVDRLAPSLAKSEKICGDRLPTDPKAYPVSFYPVSVEYSDQNLALVKKHFCEDAIKVFSKSLGKDVIQVVSLINQEKAIAFKEKLSQHFSQAMVGEPTILEKPKTQSDISQSSSDMLIYQPSRLTKEQLQQIDDLRQEERVDRLDEKSTFRPILPNYVPEGFQIDLFEVISKPGKIHGGGWQGYSIIYINQTSQCFDLTVDTSQSGGPPEKHEEIKVVSKALGEVKLAYTDFDKGYKTAEIGFNPLPISLNNQNTRYYFTSPTRDLGKSSKECKRIDLKDAVKIVENLSFLGE
jgi:hypothetical protein